MAGADRMAIEEVVRKVLVDEHADVLRESLRWLVAQLMEVEVSELIGAERGERTPDRATHRNGYRAREWQTRAGTVELQIPKIRQGSYFPSFLQPRKRSEQALLSVVQQAYVCGVSTRRVDQLVESLGLRVSRSEVSRICAGLDEQVEVFRTRPLEGPLPLSVPRRQGREGQRRRPRGAQVRGHRSRRARDRPAGDHRAGRRRRRDRGVLDGLRALAGRPRPGRRAAGHLRCPRGAEERDRQGAGCALAALHGALPQRLPGPRAQRPARAAGRADPPDLQRREPSGGARQALRGGRDTGGHAAQSRHHARSGRGRHPRLLRLPRRPLAQDALDQPARALQPRDRPAHRRRRDLPRRPQPGPPGLDARHRAKRLS
jgi:Transposase, Mutator family